MRVALFLFLSACAEGHLPEYWEHQAKNCWDGNSKTLAELLEKSIKQENKFRGTTDCLYDCFIAWSLDKATVESAAETVRFCKRFCQ